MTKQQITCALVALGSFINSAAMTIHDGAGWPATALFGAGLIGALAVGILRSPPAPTLFGSVGQARATRL